MLTVHHLGVSQSERIVWLCEELGVPYTLVRYERDPVSRLAPPEYKALSPAGTAPVITDGDLLLSESAAIIEYVIAKYGQGRLTLTPEHPDFVDYLFWFHFANGSLTPNLMLSLISGMFGGGAESDVVRSLRSRADNSFAMVEKRLGEADYFAGSEFTAADIIMLFPLSTMGLFTQRDMSPYPNLRAYLKRIGERPAYKRARSKADPELPPLV